jgi:DNA polymerase-3 subunit beta
MRATVKAGALRAAVNQANAATGRGTIPVLGCVKLAVDGDVLRVSGMDLDMLASATCATLSREAGAVCVSAMRLARFLRYLPADELVTLRLAGDRLNVDLPFGRLALMTVPAADFPDGQFEVEDLGEPIDILASDLHGFLRRIVPFISTEEVRYYLCGVCLEQQSSEIVGVATNGHVLAVIPLDQPGDPIGKARPIIPIATVRFLIAHMPRAGAASVRFNKAFSRAVIQAGDLVVATKLIDGTFPDYGRVIPQGPADPFEVKRSGTLASLRLVNAFSYRDASCRIARQADGRIALLARNFDAGELAFALPVPTASASSNGKPLGVSVNPRLLTTALEASRGDNIRIEIRDPSGPITIAGEDEATILVMPMRGDEMEDIRLPDGAVAC